MAPHINAIIVDDEESARNVLSKLLHRFCPKIKVLGTYDNLIDAVEGIKLQQPQVVFLDIEMPNYMGFEIVNFFESFSFHIIFITAYDRFAIKAFEISAFDYLLKPIDIDRLKNTVEKLDRRLDLEVSKEHLDLLSTTLLKDEITKISVSDRGYKN